MIYIKFSRRLTKKDIEERIKGFEEKYGMNLKEYEKKVVKGHEEELDRRDLFSEYEEWKHYVKSLKKEDFSITESVLKPIPLETQKIKVIVGIFTPGRLKLINRLKSLEVKSISELSGKINRDRSSVVSDLEILEDAGLVSLRKKGRNTVPEVMWDEVAIDFA